MEIIVEISEDDYNRIINKSYRSNNPDWSEAESAIAHGTQLPSGHGDLVDKDELWDLYHSNDYDFYEAIDDANVIIKADVERSE